MKRLQRVPAKPISPKHARCRLRAGHGLLRPWVRSVLWLGLLGASSGCFEDRIEERLVIGIGEQSVELFYEVRYHERRGHGERAARRVRDHERGLLDGDNDWLRAFTSIPDPLRYGTEAFFDDERDDGPPELQTFTAWAGSRRSQAALGHVFGHTPIATSLVRTGDSVELDLTAGAGLGGTRQQRLRLERELEAWSRVVADYVGQVADLWRTLEANPHRARPIYESLFTDLLDPDPEPELTPAEQALLERLDEAEGAVVEIFGTAEDQAYSLQELSRLVHDPYPLEVLVARIDGDGRITAQTPIVAEGLEPQDDGSWRVRRTSLWDAYFALRDVWVVPNPLAIKIDALRAVDPDVDDLPEFGFDLESLLRETPSVLRRPTAFEVAAEIRDRLSPPEVVRIAWSD